MRKLQAGCFLWSCLCTFFSAAAGVVLAPLLYNVLAKSVNTGNEALFAGAPVLVCTLFLLLAVFSSAVSIVQEGRRGRRDIHHTS